MIICILISSHIHGAILGNLSEDAQVSLVDSQGAISLTPWANAGEETIELIIKIKLFLLCYKKEALQTKKTLSGSSAITLC